MESFTKKSLPKLKEFQHFVILTELKTGIVLDLNGKYNLNSEDYPVLLFNTLKEAKEFAELKISENSEVECVIYNHKQEFIEMVSK